MSLVGRKAKNHPQQVEVNGALDEVDDRWTPLNLWIPWNDRWQFTLDVAASRSNYLGDRYFTLEDDGLTQSWRGERVWCNPPYSAMRDWVEKAWCEVCEGCPLVVMLAPANRTEQRWWQESIEPYRDGAPLPRCPVAPCTGCRYCEAERERYGLLTTMFLPRRINFGSRDNLGAWSASSAPFGCVLLIWEASNQERQP